MGYRLYVYEKNKERFDICLFKFYGYAEYKYIKPSWEYLWPRVIDQFPDHFYDADECEDAFDCMHQYGGYFDCNVDAATFREFIDLYISSRNEWVKNSGKVDWSTWIIDINSPEFKTLKDLYDSNCNKTLDWG